VFSEPVLLIFGLIGLVLGSELAVRVARALAEQFGVQSVVVGLTVSSIGTSIPEIATNVTVGMNALAGTADASGVAVGNILGSCLAQATLLLGLTAIVRGIDAPIGRTEVVAVTLAITAAALASMDGVVRREEGVALVIAYVLYLVMMYLRLEPRSGPIEPVQRARVGAQLALGVAALALVFVSAQAVVGGAVSLAADSGLSATTLGVFVGIGTGLPELAVALSAIRQHDDGIALGNLLGSNITDPLLSFGLGAMVHPVVVPVGELLLDFLFWVGGTIIALLLLGTGRALDRNEAGVLLVVFVLYVSMRLLQ